MIYYLSRKNSVAYVKITFSVSVSLPSPMIRSYRIEFYFLRCRFVWGLQLRPLGCAGNSSASPQGHPGHLPIAWFLHGANGNGVYGTAVRTRFYGNGYGWTET